MSKQSGLTLVELMVTIVVAGILLIALFMLSTFTIQLSANNKHRSAASALARSNMRIYANNQTTNWLNCADITGAPGGVRSYTLTTPNELPGPVTQTIEISVPYGCTGSSAGYPARFVSKVVYANGEVAHATFVLF